MKKLDFYQIIAFKVINAHQILLIQHNSAMFFFKEYEILLCRSSVIRLHVFEAHIFICNSNL